MRFLLSFVVIVFPILGILCLTEVEHSPKNYGDFLQKLSKPLRRRRSSSSVGSSEGLNSSLLLVTKAKKLLEQMEQFCLISNLNISVSAKCCADIKILLFSLISGKHYWALKMVDSLAKPPSGIMMGNTFYPGDYKECKSINVNVTPSFTPKYCQAKIPVYVDKVQQKINYTFGLCVPNSCSAADCEHLFQEGLHMLPYHLGDQLNTTVYCPQERVLDTKAIIAIIICSVIFAFIVLGTLYDVFFIQMAETEELTINSSSYELPNDETQVGSDVSLLQPAPTKVSACLKKFLLCFSILENIEKLLKTKLPDQSLPAVHGIRFLSMAWIILGHTYFFGLNTVGNFLTLLDMSNRFTFQAIYMGIYSVDTFFLISGMLVAYGTLKVLTEKEGKMNWLYFYVHRFYRLTPTYMVLLMIYVCLLKYFGSGPYWSYEGFDKDCSENWWWNLLYANNFIQNAGCMGWTWYLANDMQFYIISPLIVILLYKFPKFGILLTIILMCVQFLTSALIITHNKIKSFSPEYMILYMKPYYRIGPYLVGILLGYILHVTNCKKPLNKVFVACMWLMSIAISLAVIYGLYNTNNGESLSQPVATLYWTLSHNVWAVCVGWVIFACCSGYGGIVSRILSWKVFIPLSRLTYCAYLIHPIVMITYYMNLLYPTVITDVIESYLFIGHLVISYGFAFLASMIIEAPLMRIEAVFFRKKE